MNASLRLMRFMTLATILIYWLRSAWPHSRQSGGDDRATGAGPGGGSTWPSPASATISNTAAMACWSSTSTTATASSSGSRRPGSTPRACRSTSRGSAPAPDQAALHQHDQAVDVPGPGLGEAPLGEDLRSGLRPDGDHAGRPDDLPARHSKGRSGTSSAPRTARSSRGSRPESGSHNTIVGPDGKEAYLAGLNSPLLDGRRHADAPGRPARSAPSPRASARSRSTAPRPSAS